ncbi:uncharacterized protein bsd isoform X2 [Ochlerotatus camptorhynchus]|uniref:uncharacterized protein bsd isoform X2 n=1 Tax=Ochlerotatus camptorhynchus TaxID=644619 RepID=UPI0031D854C1
MGKRHAVDSETHQYETPQKRQKVAFETPTSCSPALNVSFTLTREFVDGTILTDLTLKDWRIGKPIGKGSFGEIFLASDDVFKPVTSENAKYVVKIEPHSNGPLFVEIHALLNTAKRSETNPIPPGMPEYIASGSHYFKNERYRFLILKRYQRDLHSLIKNKRVDPKSIPIVACQILDVLEHLHDKGYVHSDIKAENLMIGKVPVSELANVMSAKLTNSYCANNSEKSPNKKKTAAAGADYSGFLSTPTVMVKKSVEFSGSNPVRSCRGSGAADSETYQNMVKSHYLRPLKNIVYRDDSDDEDLKNSKKKRKWKTDGDSSKSFFYHITTKNMGENFKQIDVQISRKGTAFKVEAKVAACDREEDHKKKRSKQGGVGPLEERIHLIDFGLASKFIDSAGQHRPFCMDQRRAHDGTLEFTSRDAHMGAHARRSDLECLGYNLIFWSRGFLPWKDEKMLNQPEQVHRMKEYFMTDVREMLKTIYGEDCPKYLGEFLHYVGGLTYDERPDYDYLRSLFFQELQRIGYKPKAHLKLIVEDIAKLSQRLTGQDEAEITNKINHVKSLMKLGVLPYRESTLHNKTTSPKNLRSKRDSTRTPANGKTNGTTAKKEKKFCWSEILSTDPDQIARERAEKEFERADQMEEVVIRYSGNPTYAIRELENKKENPMEYMESEDYIKGYTKPMMDILRKRQSQLMKDINGASGLTNEVKEPPDDKEDEEDEQQEEDDEEEVEENGSESEEEDEDEEEVTLQEDEDEEEEEEEDAVEADSGNDDVDGEEEEEEEQIHDRRKLTQGKKQVSRKLGRTTKAAAISRKEESDSDFINDAEEEDEETLRANEQELKDDEDGAASEASEVIGKPRSGRRRTLPSESSDQKDSDFNDQESSEYESRESRGPPRPRGRPRLNRDRPKAGKLYSKANAGNNTKVPVIARNNNNNNNNHHHHKPYYGDVDYSSHEAPLQQQQQQHHQDQQQQYRLMKRRKSGLRERIRPTARSITYQDDLQQKRSRKSSQKRYSDDEDYCQVDESSCSSSHSATSVASASTVVSVASDYSDCSPNATPKRKSSRKRVIRTFSNSSRSVLSSNSRSSSLHNGAAAVNGTVAATNGHGIYSGRRVYPDDEDDFFDDDDTRDMDYSPVKSKRTRKPTSSRKTITSMKKRNGESRGSFSLV